MQTFSFPLLYYIKDLRFLPPPPPFPPLEEASCLGVGGRQAPGIFFLLSPNISAMCCYNVSQMALGQVETLYLIAMVNNGCQCRGHPACIGGDVEYRGWMDA